MATPPHQRPIKLLSKRPGRKRFVFKTFARRIKEVDVDVFRSLAPVKLQPTEGTSFFKESLVQWRELNSAADFVAVYEELLPIVQTLPQLLLHKELVVEKLLARVQLTAMLSLEPILSLIAILSRDLRADFIPFMPQFLLCCVDLLKAGGDLDPDIIEQVFISLSYSLKYMQKLLLKNIVFVLKATKQLRYYPRLYIQEFAVEAVSFLLRKSSLKQLVKGLQRIFTEIVKDPSDENVCSCSSLLFHTLKGPACGLHSRAKPLLHLLLNFQNFKAARKKVEGGQVISKVVSKTFLRLCKEVHREKLSVFWLCLLDEIHGLLNRSDRREEACRECDKLNVKELHTISELDIGEQKCNSDLLQGQKRKNMISDNESVTSLKKEIVYLCTNRTECKWIENDHKVSLCQMISLLSDILEFRLGSQVNDFKPLFEVSYMLLESDLFLHKNEGCSIQFLSPFVSMKDHRTCRPHFCSEVLRFLLAIVKCHCQVSGASHGPASIVSAAPLWASAWDSSELASLIPFIRGVLEQDVAIINAFAPYLLRTFDRFISSNPVDVLPLLMDFFQKVEIRPEYLHHLVKQHLQNAQKLVSFVLLVIKEAIKRLETGIDLERNYISTTMETMALEPAIVWAALQCLPYIALFKKDSSVLSWDYAVALDHFLLAITASSKDVGDANWLWECMLSVALSSELKIISFPSRLKPYQHISEYLGFATHYGHSPHVLKAVADLLDSSLRFFHGDGSNGFLPELRADNTVGALKLYENNLGKPSKLLRLSTLRILNRYEFLQPALERKKGARKHQNGINGNPCVEEHRSSYNVLEQLLSIEAAPLSLDTSRQSSLILARLKVHVSTWRVAEGYLLPMAHSMVGMLFNRFRLLWDSATECLAELLEHHSDIVWDIFIKHVESCQTLFLSKGVSLQEPESIADDNVHKDLWTSFEDSFHDHDGNTDVGTVLILLLQTAQKVPGIAESRSRELVPLFLAFVDNVDAHTESCMEMKSLYGSKEWKAVLKEWLNLLKVMRNARSFFRGSVLKEILINRFLMDRDSDIQLTAFECLLNWRDNFLIPYEGSLKNLISFKTLREELTTWNIGIEGQMVEADHRPGLIPVLIRILFPKVMKTKSKSTKQFSGAVQRNAILSFLAHLEVGELAPFFILLLKPLESAFISCGVESVGRKLAWEGAIEHGATVNFIEWVSQEGVSFLPINKKVGFLHMVKDVIETFDGGHIGVYLHVLLAFIFRILESCGVNIKAHNCNDSKVQRLKEGLCLQNGLNPVRHQFETDIQLTSNIEFPTNEDKSTENALCEGVDLNNASNEGVMDLDTQFKSHDSEKEFLDSLQQVDEEVNDDEWHDIPFKAVNAGGMSSKAVSGKKELRSFVFRILSIVFSKYEDLDFSPLYWDIFLGTIRPLITHFGQESMSSDAPSALFACFLSLSRSPFLVAVLIKEDDLIPSVISILSKRNASPLMIGAVLSFIENILNLENQSDASDVKVIVSKILSLNMPVLLTNAQNLLTAWRKCSRGKQAHSLTKRMLHILNQLSTHIKHPAEASRLVHTLLPFLSTTKCANIDEYREVLCIIKELTPALDSDCCGKILPLISSLLASLSHQDIRILLCMVLKEFVQVEPSLSLVAGLLTDLNSMSTTTVGEYDYDRRLQAYDRLSSATFHELAYPHALIVISQAIYDMSSNDISVRHCSSNCLGSFIHFLSSLFLNKQQEGFGMEHIIGTKKNLVSVESMEMSSITEDDSIINALNKNESSKLLASWSLESAKAVVQKVLLLHMRNAIGSDSLSLRREWMALLREMVVNLPAIASLSEYLPLVSSDTEVDFFCNINHIQIHRRIKAMSRFRDLCSAGKLSQETLLSIFMPLLMGYLFEAKGDREGNLVSAAVSSISCIAGQLQWNSYFSLLMRIFHLMASKVEHEKVLVRLLCAVIDSFHFYDAIHVDQGTGRMCLGIDSESEKGKWHGPNGEEAILNLNYSVPDHMNKRKDQQLDIQRQLENQLLPQLTKLLVSNDQIVNVKVALAVVKIVKLMPQDSMELELPRIIQNMVNLLKNRSQAVRDEARAALIAIVGFLGCNYLYFVIDTLNLTLTRGYEVHVLGFTLNALLMKVVPSLDVGAIDYCVDKLLEVLANDMFGAVSEEKDIDKIAFKMKETKRIHSFESIRLLAQTVTFRTHAIVLVKLIRDNLKRSLDPKMKCKVEMMLKQLALGFQANPSLKQDELLVFVHGLVEEGMKEEKLGKKVAAVPNLYLLTEFALQLLYNHLKRARASKRDQHALSMLDPLISLLHDCLESKFLGVVLFSMRCLCYLLRLPLPSADTIGVELINVLLMMAQKLGNTESPLVQPCFNLLIVLLKHAKNAKLTDNQFRVLLQFPIFIDLESSASNTGLLLLKAVVGQKILIPELYDMMNRVANLMVASQEAPVQKYCSQILLKFLLDYPLRFKRLQQHLDFFIANLSFEHASGREAALEMLHAVIVKFPDHVVDEQCESLFLPLVARLVNDDVSHVREMIGTVLKVLMRRVSERSLQRMVSFCFSWLNEENHQLWCVATQVLGFSVEVMKGKFSQYVHEASFLTLKVLNHSFKFKDHDGHGDIPKGLAFWQESYYCLTMFEKLVQQFPDMCFLQKLEELWDLVCYFLLHQHVYLRQISCRLVGFFFATCGPPGATVASVQEALLLQPSRLMLLAAYFCQQLEIDVVDDGLAEQIMKNLLYVTRALYLTTLHPEKQTSWLEIVSDADASVQRRVMEALTMLGFERLVELRKGTDANLNSCNPVQDTGHGRRYPLILPIFKKLEHISLQVQEVETQAIFKWYSTISTELGADGVQPYLSSMLTPLYKISESFAAKRVPYGLKSISEEVLNHIKEVVGTSCFVQAYNEVRQTLKISREERKRIIKINALVDPERHAKRKMRLALKHQAQKKRKLMECRTQRES